MNKKIRILAIINIIQVVLLIAAIVGAVIIMPDIMLFDNSDSLPAVVIQGSDSDVYNGYADVTAYGAIPDDGKDDTPAFLAAAKTGAGVYVPLGTFDINKTLNLKGQHLKGAGIDRTVIRYSDSGTIVNMSGAVIIDDITLTFKDISGNEKSGECVALLDKGVTNGAIIRSVKLSNVGTGLYAPEVAKNDNVLEVEALVIDKFSHRAIDIKAANSALFRALYVKEASGDVDTAISIGGNFTFDTVCFTTTQAQYMLCFDNADSAVIKTALFDSVTPKTGSLIKSKSSILSLQTVTVKGSKAQSLIEIDDATRKTTGNIITLIGDSGTLTVNSENRIKCQNNLSQ